ncbi:MAG: pyridoxal phosphate-dependent aminotransferase [Planctomycetota bacterium]|nr:pyridoxal phosphate-dependent aminotransferase [Planctomycetota bacterium]MDG1983669.1 pyridoxal phosphate-dependent aminotransferase [Planctomycetota bacterium]
MKLSQRVSNLKGSVTLALAASAKEMAASGRDVINMAVGEPDFDAPRRAREAGIAAINSGAVKYTPAAGLNSLRQAVADHLRETRGVAYGVENVVICHSAKHALSHTLLALVDPGDEVLLLDPAWSSYHAQVELVGGVAVHVPPKQDGTCAPDLEAIRAAVTERTGGLMFNSPSNPSGYVWSRSEIEELAAICEEHDLWMISDEIYGRLVFDDAEHVSPTSISEAMKERTILVDGASKVFAMTGYRMGYLAANADVARTVGDLQSQISGCPNYISQRAFEACLIEEPEEVKDMIATFDRRRRVVIEGLDRMGLKGPQPKGAFYAFPDLHHRFDERGSSGFCADLLEAEALATVPGTAFSAPRHIRLSYALSEDRLVEALDRLERFLSDRP